MLQLDNAVTTASTLLGFGTGDTIWVASGAFDSTGTVAITSGNVLSAHINGANFTLQLDPR